MTQNSACIVEVTANDAEMEYGPKLKGGFLLSAEEAMDPDDMMLFRKLGTACCVQYCMCFCCSPICLPLSIVWTTVGWLCFPIGHFVNDEEDPRSWRTTCANYLCCYANRWSLCASLYVFCPCFNMDPTEFVEAFGDGMRMEWLQGAQIHP